jgi:DNA-directed RNA polymerase
MNQVLYALNILQAVPFKINRPVLDYVVTYMRPGDADQETNKREQQQATSRLQSWQTDMAVAETLAGWDRFFVPLHLDFRGRMIGVPYFSLYREDTIRSLFLFADGQPMEVTSRDQLWLRAHVANKADGNSWSDVPKPSRGNWNNRIKWTSKNYATLLAIGEAVLSGKQSPVVLPTKEPVAFLAACVELAQMKRSHPGTFVTHLPIMLDATQSGLQHLSAMTRADEAGLVNLIPGRDPEDFYLTVAAAVWNKHPHLREYMIGPDDREIVKQPGMTYFYGSKAGGWSNKKPVGMTEQVVEILRERGHSAKGAHKFAAAIYKEITGMMPKARQALDFMQSLARLCAKHGKSLRWTTALGFPVVNHYYKPDIKTVSVSAGGRRRKVNLIVGETDEINAVRAANSAAANFVHSCDATLLQMVAIAAHKQGIALAPVHDCFGTVAPDAQAMLDIIREQKVALYENDVLADLYSSAKALLPAKAKLPPPPQKGSLDLKGILTANHAYR